ncbi:MAG: hypothetical protein D6769_01795 [Methanobacteriota archaeon]|nr:MAG: hypothetical protein D6769_01795 [Euryarchaeota archaeon]
MHTKDMRFGFVSFADIKQDVKYAIENRIEHIEFDLTKLSLNKIKEAKNLLLGSGLTLSFHLPWDYSINPQKTDNDGDLQYVHNAAQVLEDVGGSHLVLHMGYYVDGNREEHLSNVVEFIQKTLDHGFSSYLTLENLKPKSQISPKKFLGGRMEDFDFVFTNIRDKRLKVCFDTGHAAYAWDIEQAFTHLSKQIYCLHLHDNNGKKDHLDIGRGNIDWPSFMNFLKGKNIEGPLVLETFNKPIQEQIAWLRKLV